MNLANMRFVDMDGGDMGLPDIEAPRLRRNDDVNTFVAIAEALRPLEAKKGETPVYPFYVDNVELVDLLEQRLDYVEVPVRVYGLPGSRCKSCGKATRVFGVYGPSGGLKINSLAYLVRK